MATADMKFEPMNKNDYLKKNGDGKDVTVTFQQATERAGIQSGDSLAVAFGKLAKFCTDMQDYVFSPPVNNLLSTDTSRPLSAAMGKQLQEEVESVNSALAAFYGGTYTGSINSLRSPGTYWCDFSQVTGAIYDSGYGWIEVIKAYRDSDSCLQKIYHVSSTGIDVIAYRTYVNNQWYPTRVLNTTGIS